MPSATAAKKKPSAKAASKAAPRAASKKPGKLHFLIHDQKDDVGVAVIDIKAGEQASGLTLDESRQSVTLKALADIPLGHKIALRDFKKGDTVTKYGQDIGRVVASIKKGDHVHVHNVKTKRW
jgi:(2R)-sulfolactate sulfo-lyase subunit alpha